MRSWILASIFAASAAQAGVYLEMGHVDLAQPKAKPEPLKVWAQDGAMRSEAGDAGGGFSILRDQKLYVVEPKQKSFRVIDKAAVERMGQHLAALHDQMQARLAKMPPEQRAAMEQMMQGRMPGAETVKPEVRETSRSEKVGGHACKIWEILRGTEKEQELCVAAPGALPGGDELFAALKQMAALTEGLGSNYSGRDSYLAEVQRIGGVPILTREFQGGKATEETRLVTVRSESVAAERFQVPAGFSEQKLTMPAVPAQ